jgi:hypothetical protein
MVAVGEVAFESEGLMPELSYGSHFFQDLVESDIFYLALYPDRNNCNVNYTKLFSFTDKFEGIMPASTDYKKVVRIFNLKDKEIYLHSDIVEQRLICYQKEID